MRNTVVILVLLSVLVCTSCSFAPQDAVASGRPARFPDMHLFETRYVLGLEGSDPIKIEAKEIELYREAQQAYITDATFHQESTAGETLFSGSFGSAVVDTENNDMTLSDGVTIRNHRERFNITADELTWNHAQQTVRAEADSLVTIMWKEHDILRGTGFHGDFASATFEFTTMEEGILSHE
ncbi:MAG: LPS export ABC transporter periplasmic protein LptC [Sphaerochaetaceae bacterium]|nr:LPS export ABC transporter periplasmic protein LptC [Sphaerochaetaceae bacterium]MDD3941068.1 LPS export ABC transporter periplasmic protein LptC [Sphaerochaetaceae bacterium]MDX9939076.1 LPS export ABC transporter periplasmic protein LptC [Sphaerochaetaceae bacterium]